jgi:hypothetical protein
MVADVRQGRDTGEVRTVDLGTTAASFAFSFNPGVASANRMIVSYEGRPLFDSGCGVPPPARMMWLGYAGRMTTVTVQVIPNCAGGSGTTWDYQVSCPR